MAKTGKILALVAGLLTLIGTFFFSLLQFLTGYVYGAGGMLNIDDIFLDNILEIKIEHLLLFV